ncbi:MAG TPA: malto-oligosyltrehalose trehalohydrolase [Kofleriaceae bacterium]|nr:malto-oligosyltrehalose trehalohydrolase [Kofleriaceae bacterium]
MSRRLPIGAEIAEGGVHFRVWAPAWKQVTLVLEGPVRREIALEPEAHGYHARFVDGIGAGERYRFRLGDQLHADPASRAQPDGPFGPSLVIDPRDAAWTATQWQGITRPETQVVYEMHIGTFTPEGTWNAAAAHLPFLKDVGITTIEMMPVNEFAGRHGWGYDGVNLFAPHHHYGTPADLRAFIDRAHVLGLGVILDVVYNHFGPAGNSHFVYAPEMKRTDLPGEWGDPLNYRSRGMRELVISNARYWIDEFHFDGLRIDATQAIFDDTKPHILADIVRVTRAAARSKRIWIVGENEPQDTRMVAPIDDGGMGLDAIWNDDFEHSTRVALTGVTDGYFHDYAGTPQELVAAIEHSFLYQGQIFAWQRNTRGTPTRGLSASRFVHFLENHDQVANTGFGDRMITLTDPSSYRALTALLLLGPQIPMLFQGQETGSTKPWRFFCDHDSELCKLVKKGRAEFLQQFARLATPEAQAALPDPGAAATFSECILDPSERSFDRSCVQLHRDLLRIRRETPAFIDGDLRGAVLTDRAFCIRWWHHTGHRLLLVNLGSTLRQAVLPQPLLAPPPDHGWRLEWSSEDPTYGGHGTPEVFTSKRLAIPARCAVLLAPDRDAYLRVDPPPPSGEKELPDL